MRPSSHTRMHRSTTERYEFFLRFVATCSSFTIFNASLVQRVVRIITSRFQRVRRFGILKWILVEKKWSCWIESRGLWKFSLFVTSCNLIYGNVLGLFFGFKQNNRKGLHLRRENCCVCSSLKLHRGFWSLLNFFLINRSCFYTLMGLSVYKTFLDLYGWCNRSHGYYDLMIEWDACAYGHEN